MKLGLPLYATDLTATNLRFAKQAGASHIVARLRNYSGAFSRRVPPLDNGQPAPWSYDELLDLRKMVEAEGLALAAIENLEPGLWFDVLLDGPRRDPQIEGLKSIVRNMGRVGIPVLGYYFSLAGVWGRAIVPRARGGAVTQGYIEELAPEQTPIPNGNVWDTVYDPNARAGTIPPVSREALWGRLEHFLTELTPIAEEAGVRLAAHPDDPPLPELRQTPRLIYKPELYQRLLDLVPSRANALEFCQGTVSEMQGEMTVYEAIERYASQGKIAYVHFRNVRGKVPNYHEVFLDEGDVDMVRALHLYRRHGFDGVLIPDHTPHMSCDAPWHAGMAYALGWMRATIASLETGGD